MNHHLHRIPHVDDVLVYVCVCAVMAALAAVGRCAPHVCTKSPHRADSSFLPLNLIVMTPLSAHINNSAPARACLPLPMTIAVAA